MPEHEEPRLLETARDVDELADHLRSSQRFAFDTEFVSEETYEPVLCLIQVATAERLVAIDPLAVRDLSPFWDVVNDPAVEVVMHAASEDLRICQFQTGHIPDRLFDVQIVAGLVGYGYPLSLGNLLAQTLHVSVFGGETRTDWRRRPLSPAQVRYALDDVRYLLPLADFLRSELDRLGRRDWAESELAEFLDTIQNRAAEERWRRLPGLHQLNRRGLEVARRLADWRLEEARRLNRPLRQTLRDDLLVAIAKRQPANRPELEALRDFNRPHLTSKAPEILAAIAEAKQVPTDQLPEPSERHDDGPGIMMLVSLLSAALSNSATQMRVVPALVGTTNDIKDLTRWHVQGCPENDRPRLAKGWRREVCGDLLLDVLAGRRVLRVTDPQAEVPVSVESLGADLGKPSGVAGR